MPAKGYDSVNLPSGLYNKVKALVACRDDLGYRSITEFVAEAVRMRAEEIERAYNQVPHLEENISNCRTIKKRKLKQHFSILTLIYFSKSKHAIRFEKRTLLLKLKQ